MTNKAHRALVAAITRHLEPADVGLLLPALDARLPELLAMGVEVEVPAGDAGPACLRVAGGIDAALAQKVLARIAEQGAALEPSRERRTEAQARHHYRVLLGLELSPVVAPPARAMRRSGYGAGSLPRTSSGFAAFLGALLGRR